LARSKSWELDRYWLLKKDRWAINHIGSLGEVGTVSRSWELCLGRSRSWELAFKKDRWAINHIGSLGEAFRFVWFESSLNPSIIKTVVKVVGTGF
jgi:hypothetical protein